MLQLKKKTKTKTQTQTQIYKTPLTSYKASWVALASRSVITKSKQNHAEIDVSDYSYFIVRKDQNFVQLQHHEVPPNINNKTNCNFFPWVNTEQIAITPNINTTKRRNSSYYKLKIQSSWVSWHLTAKIALLILLSVIVHRLPHLKLVASGLTGEILNRMHPIW